MAKVLIPGSFDPITKGHVDIIKRAAAKFDKVYVAVMTNDMHKYVKGITPKTYLFSMKERREMARLACAGFDNVEVIMAGGQLISLVDCLGADWIIKGIRTAEDLAYEQQHALWNRAHNSKAETLYMPADPAFDDVSSSIARQRILAGEDLRDYLPKPVIEWINENPRTE